MYEVCSRFGRPQSRASGLGIITLFRITECITRKQQEHLSPPDAIEALPPLPSESAGCDASGRSASAAISFSVVVHQCFIASFVSFLATASSPRRSGSLVRQLVPLRRLGQRRHRQLRPQARLVGPGCVQERSYMGLV